MQIFDKNKSETKAHHFQQKDYNNTSFNRTTYPQNSKINNLNYNFNTNATQKKYNYSRNGSTVSSESGGLESVSSRKSSSNIPSHLVDSSNQTNQVQLGPQYSGQQYLPSDQNIIGYGNIQQSSNILVNANYHQKNYNQISNQNKSQYNNQYFNQNNSIHPFNYSQNVNQKVQHFYNYSNNNNTFQQAQNLQTNTYSQYPLENPNIQTQNQNQFSSQSESNNFSGQKNQFKPKLNQAGGSYKGVGQKMMTNNFQQINQGYQVNYSNYQNIQNNNNVQASSNQKLSAENSRKMLNQNFNNSNQFELKQSIEDNNINNSESSQPKYYQQGYNPDAIEDNNQ